LAALDKAIVSGAAVLDMRNTAAFGAGHFPKTINIPLNKSFAGRAGWLVRYDQDIHLIGAKADIPRAQSELALIGLERVTGWTDATAIDQARAAGRTLGTVAKATTAEMAKRIQANEVTVLDVRNKSEFAAGHIPGALHVPLGHLRARLAEIPRDKPIIVNCESGGRSAIAVSVLQERGIANATNLTGGYVGWAAAGNETVRGPKEG
jgi:hydroxyacylglutathione hydrolase